MRKLFCGTAAIALCAACGVQVTTSDVTVVEDVEIMSYEPSELLSKTLPELSEALASRETTAVDLVTAYQDRIEAVDRNGPTLQSILALNPNALEAAAASDERRANGEALGPLEGIPILLKDNIESLDPVATTAGALALKDNVPGRDSPLVAGLRAQRKCGGPR